ncbi:hypothetical protein [Synechococcus sp. ROS8604]|uniref:hypothetical protein n=1 Tax=Synechococcus sp. ROS8604 TaxID=1442557 RepID=UPI0016475A12|nr:hypothetical protein [Synechococcus sp. ROS8604]
MAMFDVPPSPETLELLEQTATTFQVDPRPVNSYRNVMEGQLLALRFDIMRRGFIRL